MNRNIHEEAQAEFLAALDHYASISADLGERFYTEIERLMKEVCAAPQRFRKYDPPACRILARDFPFAVVYIENEDHVSIIAVIPLRREPGYWKRRLD